MAATSVRVSIDADEAWAIQSYVRQHDKLGLEHDRDQQRRLHAALLYFKDNPAGTYELELEIEMAWWIDRQVPVPLMVGTRPVGRMLLLKVMAALAAAAEEEEVMPTEESEKKETEVPEPYRASFRKDDTALADFERWYAQREQET